MYKFKLKITIKIYQIDYKIGYLYVIPNAPLIILVELNTISTP